MRLERLINEYLRSFTITERSLRVKMGDDNHRYRREGTRIFHEEDVAHHLDVSTRVLHRELPDQSLDASGRTHRHGIGAHAVAGSL